MKIEDLKKKSFNELFEMSKDLNIENLSTLKKQDFIFKILEKQLSRTETYMAKEFWKF